ncbi:MULTISPECIES: hypothetical protein [unclassified Crossiella]|uniref:hypothetical protein n=1 Tax=unclassified Crossiella TaxID=2620835 RepID=UPI001FFEF961|nr:MULTISPECIES: hypothetical protein [unclassified Crossiella]MCK2236615.1 hypothetical protein [Crossiella sp. S99.2]MCK2250283.1 hypothetical protein [Crossiella sp. S99.1]
MTRAVAGAAVLAVIAAPMALAQTSTPTTPPATTSSAAATTTSSAVPTTSPSSTSPVTSSTSSPKPTTSTSTSSTRPTTSTSEKPDPGGKPWQDQIFGLVSNPNDPTQAAIVIGCAAAKPTDISSVALTIDEAIQSEVDPRVYVALAKLKAGVELGEYQITAKCGAKTLSFSFRVIGEETPGGGKTPVLGKPGKGKKNSQIGFTPRGGVETGFGGTA